MKKIYFVRHAESEATANNIAAGGNFDSPLTEHGRQQSIKAGKYLKSRKIDLIVSSPLIRALETAQIIAKEIGYDLHKILIDPVFVERGLGIYSGKPLDIFKADYEKDALDESVESVEGLSSRTKQAVGWLAKQKANRIVLVSHGDVSRALRLIHRNLPHSQLYELERHGNAEIYEFDL